MVDILPDIHPVYNIIISILHFLFQIPEPLQGPPVAMKLDSSDNPSKQPQ